MWNDLKQAVIDASGFGPAALHVVFALAIFTTAFVILRRPGPAFLAVLVFQLLNEALDAYGDIAGGEGFKGLEAIEDTAFTLAAAGVAWLVTTLARRVRQP